MWGKLAQRALTVIPFKQTFKQNDAGSQERWGRIAQHLKIIKFAEANHHGPSYSDVLIESIVKENTFTI